MPSILGMSVRVFWVLVFGFFVVLCFVLPGPSKAGSEAALPKAYLHCL